MDFKFEFSPKAEANVAGLIVKTGDVNISFLTINRESDKKAVKDSRSEKSTLQSSGRPEIEPPYAVNVESLIKKSGITSV